MPVPLLAVAAVGGLVMSGVGMYKQQQALKEQKNAQMAAVGQETTAIDAMNSAQKEEIANQQLVEGQRRTQMDLDFKRQQIQVLRNWQQARAMSLATATNQGAAGASPSSALSGAYAGESSSARTQGVAGLQNYQIGNDVFDINSKISDSRIQYADAQTAYNKAAAQFQGAGAIGAAKAGAGAGLMSMGNAVVSNLGTFGNVAQSSGAMVQRGFSFGTGPGAWMST